MRVRKLCSSLLVSLSTIGATSSAFADGEHDLLCAAPMPASPNISLPVDEAPHGDVSEWYYFNGHLVTEGGQPYAFSASFFQFIDPTDPTGQSFVHMAFFAVTDVHGQAMHQSGTGILPGAYPKTPDEFAIQVGTWSIVGQGESERLVASTADGYSLDLAMLSLKDPVAQGDHAGLYQFPDGESRFYYSRMRLGMVGTLTVNGNAHLVVGEGDFDHDWGFGPAQLSWEWFLTELDNGEEVMGWTIREFHSSNVLAKFGTVVGADCRPIGLGPSDFAMTLSGSWVSPVSGLSYENAFAMTVPSRGLSLSFTPLVPDQEIRVPGSPFLWEGTVDVHATQNGVPVHGVGFVELLGR
jgi:predicted secreted hydrolase